MGETWAVAHRTHPPPFPPLPQLPSELFHQSLGLAGAYAPPQAGEQPPRAWTAPAARCHSHRLFCGWEQVPHNVADFAILIQSGFTRVAALRAQADPPFIEESGGCRKGDKKIVWG